MSATIAVLLPCRRRAQDCITSVRSLFATAAEPERVTVVLRFDEDDMATAVEVMDAVSGEGEPALPSAERRRVLSVIGPRYSYCGMHLMFAEMAALADCDWVLLWNDDSWMPSDGPAWDTLMASYDPLEPVVLGPKPGEHHQSVHSAFPILSRAFIAAVGRPFAYIFAVDSFVCEVAIRAGVYRPASLSWGHHERTDAVAQDKDLLRHLSHEWDDPECQAAIDAAVRAVRGRLERG